MSFYNPFNNIFETQSTPHSATLRASFWQKVYNTYGVFCGTTLIDRSYTPEISHIGILDYLTLGLTYICKKNFNNRLFPESNFFNFLSTVFLVVCVPVLAVELILAAILTTICLPFIIITHAISSFIANDYKNEIENLLPDIKNIDYDDGFELEFDDSNENGLFLDLTYSHEESDYLISGPKAIKIVLHTHLQLEALYELNIGNITSNLDKHAYKLNFRKTSHGSVVASAELNDEPKNIKINNNATTLRIS